MGVGRSEFQKLVQHYGLAPERAGSDQTVRVGAVDRKKDGVIHRAKMVYTSDRWKSWFWSRPAKQRDRGQVELLAKMYELSKDLRKNADEGLSEMFRQHGKLSSEEESVVTEAMGADYVVAQLHVHMGKNWALTNRVINEYQALYGRDLLHVSRADLYRLGKTAERVQETIGAEHRGIVRVNPQIAATKHAVQMITDKFTAAQKRGPHYQEKLEALQDLQKRLDAIGPGADGSLVEAMAEKEIKKIGLAGLRYRWLGPLEHGVKANFRETLHLARAALDREVKGRQYLPQQERWRFAMNHIVGQLEAHREQIEERQRKEEEELYKLSLQDGSSEYEKGRIERRLKALEAAHAAISAELPRLVKINSEVNHLRAEPEGGYEKAEKVVTHSLWAIDWALEPIHHRLEKCDIPSGVEFAARVAPRDETHIENPLLVANEKEDVESVIEDSFSEDDEDFDVEFSDYGDEDDDDGRKLSLDHSTDAEDTDTEYSSAEVTDIEYNDIEDTDSVPSSDDDDDDTDIEESVAAYKAPVPVPGPLLDNPDPMTYEKLFDALKGENGTIVALRMKTYESIAERLAERTKDRVWLWTKMVPARDNSGLYVSTELKTYKQRANAHLRNDWKPNERDAPEIFKEMKLYANKDDGADSYRRRILRSGREHRRDLLRQFNAGAKRLGLGRLDPRYTDRQSVALRRQLDELSEFLLRDAVSKHLNKQKAMGVVEQGPIQLQQVDRANAKPRKAVSALDVNSIQLVEVISDDVKQSMTVELAKEFMKENCWSTDFLNKLGLIESWKWDPNLVESFTVLKDEAAVAEKWIKNGKSLPKENYYRMGQHAAVVKDYLKNYEISNYENFQVYQNRETLHRHVQRIIDSCYVMAGKQ